MRTSLVGRAPQLAELDMPYSAFGSRPVLFDAPSIDEQENTEWAACAALVASPDCPMTRLIRPLCGFGWRYRLRDGRPHLADLQELGGSTWDEDTALLREQRPS